MVSGLCCWNFDSRSHSKFQINPTVYLLFLFYPLPCFSKVERKFLSSETGFLFFLSDSQKWWLQMILIRNESWHNNVLSKILLSPFWLNSCVKAKSHWTTLTESESVCLGWEWVKTDCKVIKMWALLVQCFHRQTVYIWQTLSNCKMYTFIGCKLYFIEIMQKN